MDERLLGDDDGLQRRKSFSPYEPVRPSRSSRAQSIASDAEVDSTGRPLTGAVKHIYSAPGVAFTALDTITSSMLSHYYVSELGVGTAYLSSCVFVAGLLRTFTSLAAGSACDRLDTRYGRRKPVLAALVLPFSFTILALLFPVGVHGESAAAWFFLWYSLQSALYGVIQLVYNAWGTELVQTNAARNSLVAYVQVYGVVGLVGVTLLSGLLDATTGMRVLGVGVSCTMLLTVVVLLGRVPENAEFAHSGALPLVPGLRTCFQNKPFATFIFSQVALCTINEVVGQFPFMIQYVFGYDADDVDGVFSVLLLLYVLGSLLIIPVTSKVIKRKGLRYTFLLGMALLAAYGVLGAAGTTLESMGILMIALFLLGCGATMATYVASILASNVIDYDELLTGRRREATYHSTLDVPSEFFSVAGRALPLLLLSELGFDEDADTQNDGVIDFLRYFPTLIALPACLVGYLLMHDFALDSKPHMAVLLAIERRKDGDLDVRNPVTDEPLPPLPQRDLVDDHLEEMAMHFSGRELGYMTRLPRRTVVALYATNLVALTGYTAVLLARGVQLLVERDATDSTVVTLAGGAALVAVVYELLRLRALRWFLGIDEGSFVDAVNALKRSTPALRQTMEQERWSPWARLAVLHGAVALLVWWCVWVL